MFRFAHPHFLWLLALLLIAAWWRSKQGPSASIRYSTAQTLRKLGAPQRSRAGAWLGALRLLALAFLIVALARPQAGRTYRQVESSGVDILLAVDVSGSMEALDFTIGGEPASRLEVVKSVVARFIEKRPNDRLGLVAFAGRPYLASPLTLHHDWLVQNLERLQIGLVDDGTAIGSGLAAAVNRLRDRPAKSKIVILLTDGVNNAGKVAPITAAEAASALGVKVYTIAAGAEGEAPMPAQDMFGRKRYVMQRVDVDEKTLQAIAEKTGGKFYRARDTKSLEKIYDEIDKLEKTPQRARVFEQYRELFPWWLIPGVMLLGLEWILAQTRYRRIP